MNVIATLAGVYAITIGLVGIYAATLLAGAHAPDDPEPPTARLRVTVTELTDAQAERLMADLMAYPRLSAEVDVYGDAWSEQERMIGLFQADRELQAAAGRIEEAA